MTLGVQLSTVTFTEGAKGAVFRRLHSSTGQEAHDTRVIVALSACDRVPLLFRHVAEASGPSRGQSESKSAATTTDDNQEVEVVGRVGDGRAAGRCGHGASAAADSGNGSAPGGSAERRTVPTWRGCRKAAFAFGTSLCELEMEPTTISIFEIE